MHVAGDVPLPGPPNRFDYQSVDPQRGWLYISHMNAGSLLVFDLDSSRVVGEVAGTPRATGVRTVPARHAVYVSAAGRHEVVVIDDRTLAITAHVGGIQFPDGIAYAPQEACDDRPGRRGRECALRIRFALHSRHRADAERARGGRSRHRAHRTAVRPARVRAPAWLHPG
jgi:hypothetical protein